MVYRLACAALGALFIAGCSQYYVDPEHTSTRIIKVSAVGYGAVSQQPDYSAAQQRLLGIRASKMDAYRNLAEQVYGLRVNGQTTVSAMAVQHDNYRGYVDAMLRGARVLSVTPLAEGSYETVMEVELHQNFFHCLSSGSPSSAACAASLLPVVSGEEVSSGPCSVPGCYPYPNVVYHAVPSAGETKTDASMGGTAQ